MEKNIGDGGVFLGLVLSFMLLMPVWLGLALAFDDTPFKGTMIEREARCANRFSGIKNLPLIHPVK